MSRISRFVILVTSLAAVVGAMAGTASAVTWHVSGTGTFTATSGNGTLNATNTNLTCPSSTATGAYSTGSIVSATYNITGSVTFSGCSLAGQVAETNCGYTLTLTVQPTVTTFSTGIIDLTCGVTATASNIKVCHISGQIHAYFHNRTAIGDLLGLSTTATLRVQGPSSVACPLGPNDTAHLNTTTFTVTSNGGNGPNIVRTA